MGAIITIHKDGIIFDTNGDESLEYQMNTKKSIHFKHTIININVRDIEGVSMLEMVDVVKPNRRIHWSVVEKVIDINGVEHTGVDIDSNMKILNLVEQLIK